jgi:hypothetical protein
MDLTAGSETSAKLNLTPGKYPKENIQDSLCFFKKICKGLMMAFMPKRVAR